MKAKGIDSTDDAMPPKLDSKSETKRLNIVAPASWLKKVNEWRRVQPDMPNISEAIRRLVESAIEGEKKDRKGR